MQKRQVLSAKGNYVVEEPGKGFRRIVSAPNPVNIVEIDAIKALLDADQVVIACGGGGIPVLEQDHRLKGASAVIEKDLTAGKMAEETDADELIILTSVEKVKINMDRPEEEELGEISVAQAKNTWKKDILENITCIQNSEQQLNSRKERRKKCADHII